VFRQPERGHYRTRVRAVVIRMHRRHKYYTLRHTEPIGQFSSIFPFLFTTYLANIAKLSGLLKAQGQSRQYSVHR
jgi:hypothetical protein